jgi:uncharacterized membrane protein YeiB
MFDSHNKKSSRPANKQKISVAKLPDRPETGTHAAGASVAPAERVVGFDVARALAILGMVVVHFSLVMAADRGSPGWLSAALSFLDGRPAATFVILAGVGVTLMARRAVLGGDPRSIATVRRALIIRGIILLALGFINLRIWPGDILRVYGVSLVVVAWLTTASDRKLLLGALACAAGFVALFLMFDFEKNWDWDTLSYRRLWTAAGLVRNLFYDGFRSVFPWTGFLFFGMWLGRVNLRDPAVNRSVFLAAIATGLGAEVVSWLCVSYFLAHPHGLDAETVKALFGTESMPALPLFLLASGGEAVAVIASCVRLSSEGHSRCWHALAATGQMALTWYFAHIVLGLGAIVALGLTNSQTLLVAAGCGAGFFAAAVVVSWLWKLTFRHGPLEWVMRKLAREAR